MVHQAKWSWHILYVLQAHVLTMESIQCVMEGSGLEVKLSFSEDWDHRLSYPLFPHLSETSIGHTNARVYESSVPILSCPTSASIQGSQNPLSLAGAFFLLAFFSIQVRLTLERWRT